MIPLRRLVSLVLVAAFVAGACSSESGSSRTVATVGDAVITEGDLSALFDTATLPVDEQLRSTIFVMIAREVFLDSMAEDFGLSLDGEQVSSLYDEILAEMDNQGLEPADFLQVPDAGLGMVRFDAEIAVIRRQVVAALAADPAVGDEIFSDLAGITTVCAHHILVATEDEALTVMDRLTAGEDFGAIADEVSLDSGAGGDLGCRLASAYVPEFADATITAPIGEVIGPVETEYGFHLILVDDRTALDRAEFDQDPTAVLSSDQTTSLWEAWFNEQLQDADVTVEERYGTWSPIGIAAPEA